MTGKQEERNKQNYKEAKKRNSEKNYKKTNYKEDKNLI